MRQKFFDASVINYQIQISFSYDKYLTVKHCIKISSKYMKGQSLVYGVYVIYVYVIFDYKNSTPVTQPKKSNFFGIAIYN